MTTQLYRKVGGLHWFRLGRLRIAICWSKPKAELTALRLLQSSAPKHRLCRQCVATRAFSPYYNPKECPNCHGTGLEPKAPGPH